MAQANCNISLSLSNGHFVYDHTPYGCPEREYYIKFYLKDFQPKIQGWLLFLIPTLCYFNKEE